MRIALELARHNKVYEGVATKFFEHFIYIGAAMKKMGGREYQLWDEKDGFFYDVSAISERGVSQVPAAVAGGIDSAVCGLRCSSGRTG